MIKNILYLSILINVGVLALIGFNVYHNSKTSTVSEDTNIQAAPITPTFDTKTIDELKTRSEIIVNLQDKAPAAGAIEITPTPNLNRDLETTVSGQFRKNPQL